MNKNALVSGHVDLKWWWNTGIFTITMKRYFQAYKSLNIEYQFYNSVKTIEILKNK